MVVHSGFLCFVFALMRIPPPAACRPPLCLLYPHYASFFEATKYGIPPPPLRPANGREVGSRWGSRQAKRKRRAKTASAAPPSRGTRPGGGGGGGGTPALPTSCPAGHPLPQLPLPQASGARRARRRGPRYGLMGARPTFFRCAWRPGLSSARGPLEIVGVKDALILMPAPTTSLQGLL